MRCHSIDANITVIYMKSKPPVTIWLGNISPSLSYWGNSRPKKQFLMRTTCLILLTSTKTLREPKHTFSYSQGGQQQFNATETTQFLGIIYVRYLQVKFLFCSLFLNIIHYNFHTRLPHCTFTMHLIFTHLKIFTD